MPQVSRNNLIAYIPQVYQLLKGQAHSITTVLYQNQVGNQVEAFNASAIEIKVFDKYLYPTPTYTFTKAAGQITFGTTQAGTEGHITINLTQAQIDAIPEGAVYFEIKYVTSNNNIILPKLKVADLTAAGGVSPTGAVSGNVFTIPAPLYKVQSFLHGSNDLPAAGKIVLNSSNPASVTKALFNNTDERGKRNAYLENFLLKRFSEGSSDVTIALTDITDTSIYHLYTVTNWTRKDLDGDSVTGGIGDGIELSLSWEASSVSQNATFPFAVDQRIGILLDAIGVAGTSGSNQGSNLTVSSGSTGSISFPNITEIRFVEGATIVDGSNGIVEVTVSGTATDSATTSDVTANITAGAINIGDTVPTGTTLQDLVEKLLLTTYNPTFVAPTFSLSDNVANLIEIGSVINVGLTFNFNRGSIKGDLVGGNWDANATQDFRAGAASSYTIEGNTQPGNTYTVNNHTVVEGSNSFSGTVTYGVGPQPVDSNGSNYSTPLAGGTSPSQSTSFEGVYPIFLGNNSGAEDKRALVSHSANNIECEQSYNETGSLRHRIAIPNDMIDSRTVSWQQFNTLNNQWENISSGEFTPSSVTRTVQGNTINYTLYTKSASIGGPASYRIVFS
jgi:hypothetical protein